MSAFRDPFWTWKPHSPKKKHYLYKKYGRCAKRIKIRLQFIIGSGPCCPSDCKAILLTVPFQPPPNSTASRLKYPPISRKGFGVLSWYRAGLYAFHRRAR